MKSAQMKYVEAVKRSVPKNVNYAARLAVLAAPSNPLSAAKMHLGIKKSDDMHDLQIQEEIKKVIAAAAAKTAKKEKKKEAAAA